ncbi:MAG: hypothetical protein J6V09_02635 [Clostridia bacterium]|nr:hypothetical protein [Clostridia bacterium]
MFKSDTFVTNDITRANIASLSKKQSRLEEQRICEISELADDAARYGASMLADGYGVYEVLSLLSDSALSATVTNSAVIKENEPRLLSYVKMTDARDRVSFSELFTERLSGLGFKIGESDFLRCEDGDRTFTYVKNPLADEAYDVFSQEFDNPRVKYSVTLAEAAARVGRGEVEFALLPLEERGGARLAAVAAILFKEDLKINSVIPVFGYEGTADVKYALVSRHFSISPISPDDDRYLEIRLRADSSVALSELFFAADALGTGVYRLNTITFDTEDGPILYYSVVFRDEGRDFTSLLTYLTLFSGAYTPIGIYKNLE